MLETEVRHEAPRRVASAFVPFAWGVLACNIATALWGAYVRASGSGAGCGNHWPLCDGEVIPHSPTVNKIIEFSHRASTAVDFIPLAILVIWAFRAFPKRHPVRTGAVLSMIFFFTEALIGASLVLMGHVAKNASITRAYSLSTHLLNTLTLLACVTLTARYAAGKPVVNFRAKGRWMAAASVAVVALLGVTGAIAALGDTLFPAQSLAAGLAQDWNPAANIFVRLRGLHPLVAVASGVWLAYFAISSVTDRPDLRRQVWTMGSVLGLQIAAGALNLVLLAPIWMQMIHLLLAYLLWIALVQLCASLLAEKSRPAL